MKISRREFLKAGVTSSICASVAPSIISCASAPVRRPKLGIEDIIASGARVMWIAAHPDDEALVGSIMVKSSLLYKNPLYFLVLTQGDGGECCIENGCLPDLASVREKEMKRVAELYHAELQQEKFFNAPLPVESFPNRREIADIWMKHKDPERLIAKAIREFKPDLLFTFDPSHGFTGHPEHQAASRFATSGVRLAANTKAQIDNLKPHKVSHVYYGLNRYLLYNLLAKTDPGPVTETWDATSICYQGKRCRDLMAEFSKPHKSQDRDMGNVRRFKWFIDVVYLRKTDPFVEIYDPFEPIT